MNKEGYGAIFRNSQKQSEKSPDYTGSLTIDGKEIKLSCWIAESKTGIKYFQVKVNNFEAKAQKEQPVADTNNDFVDDKVPF